MHAYTYTYIHACIHTYIHTPTYIHVSMYIHSCTYNLHTSTYETNDQYTKLPAPGSLGKAWQYPQEGPTVTVCLSHLNVYTSMYVFRHAYMHMFVCV